MDTRKNKYFLLSAFLLAAITSPLASFAQDDEENADSAVAEDTTPAPPSAAATMNMFLGAVNQGLRQNPAAQTVKMQRLERNIDRAQRDIKRIEQLNDAIQQAQPQCSADGY